jgi:hypothetical protein
VGAKSLVIGVGGRKVFIRFGLVGFGFGWVVKDLGGAGPPGRGFGLSFYIRLLGGIGSLLLSERAGSR